MGAYDGLYPARQKRSAHLEESWTVEYDTGEMMARICGLPPVMGRRLDTFHSRATAEKFAANKQNAVIVHYEELVYDR